MDGNDDTNNHKNNKYRRMMKSTIRSGCVPRVDNTISSSNNNIQEKQKKASMKPKSTGSKTNGTSPRRRSSSSTSSSPLLSLKHQQMSKRPRVSFDSDHQLQNQNARPAAILHNTSDNSSLLSSRKVDQDNTSNCSINTKTRVGDDKNNDDTIMTMTMTLDFWTYDETTGKISGRIRYHPSIEDGTWITTTKVLLLSKAKNTTTGGGNNCNRNSGEQSRQVEAARVVVEIPKQDDVITTVSGSRYHLLRPRGQYVMNDVPNGYSIEVIGSAPVIKHLPTHNTATNSQTDRDGEMDEQQNNVPQKTVTNHKEPPLDQEKGKEGNHDDDNNNSNIISEQDKLNRKRLTQNEQSKAYKFRHCSPIPKGYVVDIVGTATSTTNSFSSNSKIILSPLSSPVIPQRKRSVHGIEQNINKDNLKQGEDEDEDVDITAKNDVGNNRCRLIYQKARENQEEDDDDDDALPSTQPPDDDVLGSFASLANFCKKNDSQVAILDSDERESPLRQHMDKQNNADETASDENLNGYQSSPLETSNTVSVSGATKKMAINQESSHGHAMNERKKNATTAVCRELQYVLTERLQGLNEGKAADVPTKPISIQEQRDVARDDARQKYISFLGQQNLANQPEDSHNKYHTPRHAEIRQYNQSEIADLSDDAALLQQIIQNGEHSSQERSQLSSLHPSLDKSVNNPEERKLEFGYFLDGKSVFRNRLNKDEKLQEGFLSLSNMVLPESHHAVITTFSGSCATVHWMYEAFDDIPNVLVLSDCQYGRNDSAYINYSQRPGWRWIRAKPIGRGPRPVYKNKAGIPSFADRPKAASSSSAILQHSKLLLFRSSKGLRIVVSGNNFTQRQYLQDRDCLWVQDIPSRSEESFGRMNNNLQVKEMNILRDFITDLCLSGPIFGSFDQDENENSLDKKIEEETEAYIRDFSSALFQSLNEQQLNKQIRFVYSFPRRRSWITEKDRDKFERVGGWQQLAEAIFSLRESIGLVGNTAGQSLSSEKNISGNKESRRANRYDDYSIIETDDEEEEQIVKTKSKQKNPVEPLSHGILLEDDLHLYAMSGSFGNIVPNFVLQMRAAMVGHGMGLCERIITSHLPLNWSVVKKTYCLWPDIEMMKLMNPLGISGRGIPKSHWELIPSAIRQKLFHNSVPNPDEPALRDLVGRQGEFGGYHSFAHGKVLFATNNPNMARTNRATKPGSPDIKIDRSRDYAALYVGSHNFSKKAWGLNGMAPGNVEFGVVMITNDVQQAWDWCSRLPYCLPEPGSRSRADYMPGSAWLQEQRQILRELELQNDGYETENEDYYYEEYVRMLSMQEQ